VERGPRRALYAGRGAERQLGGPCSEPSEHKRLRRWGWTPPDWSDNGTEGGSRRRDSRSGLARRVPLGSLATLRAAEG